MRKLFFKIKLIISQSFHMYDNYSDIHHTTIQVGLQASIYIEKLYKTLLIASDRSTHTLNDTNDDLSLRSSAYQGL